MALMNSVISSLVFILMLRETTGSVISFAASPAVIQTYLTETLTVHCGLNDTENTRSPRGVSQTTDDVLLVTSIVISLNSQHVASVTKAYPAKALVAMDNLQVSGSVAGQSGDEAYFHLVWTYPTKDQVGQYLCRVNGLDKIGINVEFTKPADVSVVEPTVSDLVRHIRDLKVEAKRTNDQTINITDALKEKDQQIANITDVLSLDIQTLKEEVSRLKHVENGTLSCGSRSSFYWTDDSNSGNYHYTYNDVTQNFSIPYDAPPTVHIGVDSFRNVRYSGSTGYGADFIVELVSVTTTGFTMRCKTLDGSVYSNHVYYMSANWISLA